MDIGADVGGSPQRRGFLQEAINSRLLEPVLAFPLLPLKFDLVLPYLFFALGLTLYPPFELPHAVFPVFELGRGDDIDRDLCDHTLDRPGFAVLPGAPLLLALVASHDRET
jgi:hypothetical protein